MRAALVAAVPLLTMRSAPSPARRCSSSLFVALLAGSLALGAVACSSSDSAGGTTDGTTEIGEPATADAGDTSTAASSPSSDPAPTTAPTTTVVEPVGVPEPATAAQKLYDAWVAGDREAAATIADPPAIDAVFAATPGPYELYRGCDSGEFDTGGCLFRDRTTNNTIQIDLEKRDSGWVVAGAFFSPG